MRNKYFLLIVILLSSLSSFSQNKKGQLKIKPNESYTLYVSFLINFEMEESNYNDAIKAAIPQFSEMVSEYGITVKKGIAISSAKLSELESQAEKITGSGASVRKLNNILELHIADESAEKLLELATKLEKLDKVEYCDLMSRVPVRPPGDILPVTSVYDAMQTYKGNNGVKMNYAWEMGLKGEGINVRDIEYGFNKGHEELNDINTFLAPGMTLPLNPLLDDPWFNHGTAVIGIVYAHDGDYGITGMAHEANELILYPEETTAGYNRINAITKCIDNSSTGDVIMYEMQTFGAFDEYVPAEYNIVVWDLTKAASDAGIVIVAAAGNGSGNLNGSSYNSYNNRGDSGAIIVGAGTPDNQHDRLDFSTYGARVDVHAWGRNVFTIGYGDYEVFGFDENQSYTGDFGGTSSATPIVASCVIVLQSYYHQLSDGGYLTGPQMRELLKATGTPQGTGGGLFKNIGPIPNMENAIPAVEQMLGVNEVKALGFTVYPNPIQDKLYLNNISLSGNAAIEVYNTLGQKVYALASLSTAIDFTDIAKGVYVVRVTDNGKIYTKKVVKK